MRRAFVSLFVTCFLPAAECTLEKIFSGFRRASVEVNENTYAGIIADFDNSKLGPINPSLFTRDMATTFGSNSTFAKAKLIYEYRKMIDEVKIECPIPTTSITAIPNSQVVACAARLQETITKLTENKQTLNTDTDFEPLWSSATFHKGVAMLEVMQEFYIGLAENRNLSL